MTQDEEIMAVTATTGSPEDVLSHAARKIADMSMRWGHHYTAFERARDIEPLLREFHHAKVDAPSGATAERR